jgi:endoglucanase
VKSDLRTELTMPLLVLLAAAAVNLNQLGFRPDDPKRAVIADAANDPLDWTVVDERDAPVLKGRTVVGGDDAVSGDHVHVATFTALTHPGTYRLRVDGAESGRFRIGRDIYAPLALNALNFFYHQRAGTPIDARWW